MKEIKCKFDLDMAQKEASISIITIFEEMESLTDVTTYQKVDAFSTYISGLARGYEICLQSLNIEYTDDLKIDLLDYLEELYEEWDEEIVTEEELWINVSTLIRALG